MHTKITRDVLESYLNCKFKGHLKLIGQKGTKCDYETLLTGMRAKVSLAAIGKILARHGGEEIPRNIPLNVPVLKQGASFLLDATLEDDFVCIAFDGLKKADGPSKLGDYHYVPMLFHEGTKIGKVQRLLLEVYGLLLSRFQGKAPAYGIVWHGQDCKATRVRLNLDQRRADQLLRELNEMTTLGSPKLILNDHCQVCEFRQQCHQQAVKEDNLSLLRGMSEKEIKKYARKGILTLTQLAHTFRPRRKGKRKVQKANRHYHALQALAIRDKKIYVFGTPELPDSPVRIYLDMEGDPEDGYIYLIGMIVVQGGSETRYSFWADAKEHEEDIFEKFLAQVREYDNFLVFCYGRYERTFFKRMRKAAKRKKPVDRVLSALVNILSLVYAHIYFPCHSNGLKDVACSLGYSWTEPEASGIQSIVWRKKWEATKGEEWKQKLTTYNQEDCAALKRVTEVVFAASTKVNPPDGPSPEIKDGPTIAWVKDIDKLIDHRKWGKVNFVHPDYDFINNCAYFDYQRDRVYVRTSKMLRKRKAKARAKGSSNRTLRVTKRVAISSLTCPFCKSKNINQDGERKPRHKRAYDLAATSSGIKRMVIECEAQPNQCLNCGKEFMPQKYERLAKYFHGLMSWAIYQHVAHCISFGTLEEMFADFFDMRIDDPIVYTFKSQMASFYRPTYKQLLRRLLNGNLLHVDETEVKLKTEKGYVWVLASLEDVVFIYRPTREGDFLKELLKDFHGVLVSDFYAAYDGIACPQQKCLIHLMRDMNQELLNNPYDEELKSITNPFGVLLREVVGTVDKHGLKRRHLQKHKRDVAGFFKEISDRPIRSEPADSLRNRLMKNQDKLFTFLDYDGVPWNNNNAENAIKRFAYYREDTAGTMKEPGLNDYLLLLSICHTCRYRRVSFYKFLMSRMTDIDRFCEGNRRRRQPFGIDVYPKGYTPLGWKSWQRPREKETNDEGRPGPTDK